jgi:Uma2 family endonuclease
MSSEGSKRYTLEEYFELERDSAERWEFFGGEVFCMSGVSRNHGELESNLMTSLTTALRERGCRVYPANIRVKVPAAPPYRYPDLSIVCEEPAFETIGGVDVLANPVVLVDVLSPSTEAYDRGDKFTYYKSISSLREYVLVAQHRTHVTHYVRGDHGKWDYEELNGLEASVMFTSVGCTIALNDIYRGLRFDPPSAPSPDFR